MHYTAFQPKESDKDGISLFFEKEEAGRRFGKPIFGFLNVHAGSVEKISNGENFLQIREDLDDLGHASLIGIPYFYDIEDKPLRNTTKKRAQEIASEVASKASEINDYIPEGFPPEDLLK